MCKIQIGPVSARRHSFSYSLNVSKANTQYYPVQWLVLKTPQIQSNALEHCFQTLVFIREDALCTASGMMHIYLDVIDDLIFLLTGKNDWIIKPVLFFANLAIAYRVSIKHLAQHIRQWRPLHTLE